MGGFEVIRKRASVWANEEERVGGEDPSRGHGGDCEGLGTPSIF